MVANVNALNFKQAAIGSQCELMKGVMCVLFRLIKD